MFESIKHWFQSANTKPHLFDHSDDESIHLALASVLYHIINTSHHESRREVSNFKEILMSEFDLSEEQADYLHAAAESATSDFKADLEIIKQHLVDKPMIKKRFMEKLIYLISIDGVLEDEMDDFYTALHVIFPEIKLPQGF